MEQKMLIVLVNIIFAFFINTDLKLLLQLQILFVNFKIIQLLLLA